MSSRTGKPVKGSAQDIPLDSRWKPHNGLTPMLAACALASLSVFLNAQTTSTPHPKPTTSGQHRTTDHNSPQHHLQEAKRVLNRITVTALEGDAGTQVADIRRHFNELESGWRASQQTPPREASVPPGHVTGHVTGTSGTTGTGDWMTHYSAIDQILDRMLGANASISGSTTAGTTGSAGAGAKTSTDVKVDASTRTKLTELRKHLDAFHATAMTATPSRGSAALDTREPHGVAASGASATAADSASTQATGTTGISPEPASSTRTSRAADDATIARLSSAIDDMLRANTSTSTNSVCVDRAKLEQLHRDIEALREVRQVR